MHAVGDRLIQSYFGNRLAESSSKDRVEIFWVGEESKFKVRTIGISPREFNTKDELSVNALVWSDDGRYLAIGSKDWVEVWDTAYQCFAEISPDDTLVALCAECKKRQACVIGRVTQIAPKIKALKDRFEELSKNTNR